MDQALHPIEAVSGSAALLSHILELQVVDDGASPATTDYAFSESTRATLCRAAAVCSTETEDGRLVVDPGSYMRAALAVASERMGDATVYVKPDEKVLAAIPDPSQGPTELIRRLKSSVGEAPAAEAMSRIIADPSLTSMLGDAARIAREVSSGQMRVDARHALVACLKTLEGQQAIWTDGLTAEPPTITIDRIRSTLEDAFREGSEQNLKASEPADDVNAWSAQLGSLQSNPSLRLPEPERRSDSRYVRDDPARTLAEDRLGIADEARALSEVMCLRDPGPPLAIGLFGDWGSGKSTYMNLIEAAINELAERTAVDPAVGELFVNGVVHIKFNAWHYNDADLWASLTSEFFRQLRVGGHSGRAKADYSELVRQVAERVAKAEREAEAAGTELDNKRVNAQRLGREIDALRRGAQERRAAALTRAAFDVLQDRAKTDPAWASKALDLLGHEGTTQDAEKRVALLGLEAERALDVYGRVSALCRGLLNALAGRERAISRAVYFALGGGTLLIVVFVGLQALLPQVFGAGVAALLGLLSAVGGIGGALLRVFRFVEPVFWTADQFALKLKADEQAAAEKEERKRTELAQLEDDIAEIEERRRDFVADAARFRGASPEQVLDFFLRETETTRAFEGALGIVSRVRAAFEQLDAIFRERKAMPSSGPAPTRFERIVLYIDDLDRCRAKQVVEVLEAVHLLLAFPLFVVVVGVDGRWLEKSLLEFYEQKLDPAGDSPTGPTQATVHDFLEKIFQVPVRLRPISALPSETYAGYVRYVAGSVVYSDFVGDERVRGGTKATRTSINPIDVEIKPVQETASAVAERVRLTRDEVKMFEQLGPILGKSPRAVKRFVNLYRLVRGMRRGADLDSFLDATDAVGVRTFVAYQFWLAVDVGCSLEQARRLRRAVPEMAPRDQSTQALIEPVEVPGEPGREWSVRQQDPWPNLTDPHGWDDLRAFWENTPVENRPSMHDAFAAVSGALPGEAGIRVLQQALTETRRFSSAKN